MAKILLLTYSTYNHQNVLSESIKQGLEEGGATVTHKLLQEVLPAEALQKMHAAPKPDLPTLEDVSELTEYDGFFFAFPTRYGRAPAAFSSFADRTGGLWAKGALLGKTATICTSAGSQHGGLESTALTTLPFFVHHGIVYVPLGPVAQEVGQNTEIHGASFYGAGNIANGDGSRQVSELEKTIAVKHGQHFAKITGYLAKGKASPAAPAAARALPADVAAPAAPVTNGEEQKSGYAVKQAGNTPQTASASAQTASGKKGLFNCCASPSQKHNFES
ncbi:uncharacterized protein L969DRAFT_20351 [Mixia osmundae IAM 14324]|uniref:Flavodoxin-like domain-containing protein n=1 Tax=Mixia osmundae (strain CBS 9802 / IAM 14324 / JCM 22182 / KY 12970) TaxID=764103 RepID=G7DV42_MIXOS|nr:uncharacterized protein L969DRAFT_20351 [Mixia osmundae IAM 14324]KEI36331.1 hypothetical protein L969DRAFT_20351 [Mixia osmundae IAM 14324]GAA94452.1 hypothetical protein E5Q_01104 [Mixia osmundae IAM 14324]